MINVWFRNSQLHPHTHYPSLGLLPRIKCQKRESLRRLKPCNGYFSRGWTNLVSDLVVAPGRHWCSFFFLNSHGDLTRRCDVVSVVRQQNVVSRGTTSRIGECHRSMSRQQQQLPTGRRIHYSSFGGLLDDSDNES